MAKLNIKTRVIVPKVIAIPLVRADHLESSNVFRVCFEVFLSVGSSVLGVILTTPNPSRLHWIFFGVSGLATLSFLLLTFFYLHKAQSMRG